MVLGSEELKLRFDRKWAAYALAGGAVLGGAPTMDAAVIWSGPLNLGLSVNHGTDFLPLDLDNDGMFDLTLGASSCTVDTATAVLDCTGTAMGPGIVPKRGVFAYGEGKNQLLGDVYGFPNAFQAGEMIGPGPGMYYGLLLGDSKPSIEPPMKSPDVSSVLKGNWPNDITQTRYLGVEFQSMGNTHYGWVGIAAELGSASLNVSGFAFDNTPGASILAGDNGTPEPSSMALFGLGAAGILALKRRRKNAA